MVSRLYQGYLDGALGKGKRTMALTALLLALVLAVNARRPGPQKGVLANPTSVAKATFAGGCFWCMQAAFDGLPGVVSTQVGYTGGQEEDPTYEEVSAGGTGHAESIEVTYDPDKISYRDLLKVFWHNVDPTTKDREFCDVGRQYRTAIFFHDAGQEREAKETAEAIEKNKPFKEPIVTEIVPASTFYPAEDYHQEYYRKNPIRYRLYRYACGRDRRLRELWEAASGGH
jgi:peptide-methionine (S)-S-oxide reductase